MRQHSIDLMPGSIRARGEAVLRTGRFVAAAIAALAVLLIVGLHSLLAVISAQEELFRASVKAERVFATEAKSQELQATLRQTNAFIDLYDRMALPIEISAVMATVINNLPPSVTLDQFDLDAGARPTTRTARAKGPEDKDEAPPRILTGEVSGFAASDSQIAELVARLNDLPPFEHVNLDFSRTRTVNGRDAREFRLSFRIDLDVPYQVVAEVAQAEGN